MLVLLISVPAFSSVKQHWLWTLDKASLSHLIRQSSFWAMIHTFKLTFFNYTVDLFVLGETIVAGETRYRRFRWQIHKDK